MSETSLCLFNEPWVGRCKEPALPRELCCTKHSQEKCQVCGEQALTRCNASIGVMCGVPLCHLCGAGEMCLQHATAGPLLVIRSLLGQGPVRSIFSTPEQAVADQWQMDANSQRLRNMFLPISQEPQHGQDGLQSTYPG